MCHFRAQNGPFVINKTFLALLTKKFFGPIGSSHCAKFKKMLMADPVTRMCHFWAQNGKFAPNKIFLEDY